MRRFSQIWDALVVPHPSITGIEDRRGAALIAKMMVAHVALIVLVMAVMSVVVPVVWDRSIWVDQDMPVYVAGTFAIVVCYFTLRSGRYRLACGLYVATTAAAALTAPFLPDPNAEIANLATISVSILVAAIVFPLRIVVGVIAATTAVGLVQVARIDPSSPRSATGTELLVVMTITNCLVVMFRRHFAAVESDRLQQMRDTEARFAAAAEQLPEVLYQTDRLGTLTYVSTSASKVFGWRADEIIGRPFTEFLVPERSDGLGSAVFKASNENRAVSGVSTAVLARDGRQIECEVDAAPLYRGGDLVGVIGLVRDVSERLREREELERKNRVLSQLNDYSMELASLPAAEDIFRVASARMQQVMGAAAAAISTYDPESKSIVCRHASLSSEQRSAGLRLMGRHFEGMRFPLAPEMHARILDEVVGTVGTIHEATFGGVPAPIGAALEAMFHVGWLAGIALIHDSELIGTMMVAGKRGRARPDPDDLRAFAGVTSNAVARWLSETERIASESRYRLMAENMHDIIFQMSPSHVLTYVSPSAEAVAGVPPDRLIGRSIWELATPASAEPIRRVAEQRMARSQTSTIESVTFEVELVRVDGTGVWVEVVSNPVYGVTGALTGFQGVARDISERKEAQRERERLQSQLLQSQKMESIGRLAGGIAHDFNNLLTPIMGQADLALGELPDGSTTARRMEQIIEAAERAAQLTRQILAYSRKQVLALQLLDLNQVIAEHAQMLRRLIGEDVDLASDLAADLSSVRADRTKLEQIIMNLALNARDAMPSGGRLTVRTSNAQIVSAAHRVPMGSYAVLEVTDTGAGMGAETLRRVFEPFFTTKGPGKGTGLGLSTVQGIVEQHGGHITVDSEVGVGTTFRVYLPAASGAADEVSSVAADAKDMRGTETVLVVEDEDMVRQVACDTLTVLGYTTLAASSPAEGQMMASAHDGPIDLLLSDVIMPGMNGRDMYRHILKVRPGLPALFMSGYTDDVVSHHGMLDDGVDLLGKPFTTGDLALRVREALDAASKRSAK